MQQNPNQVLANGATPGAAGVPVVFSAMPPSSLAEMAQRDLDAALQLLADRAQYITGASGAAIALRREGRKDMLCRASSGSNAPELGALLSAEFGLSGESVRTGKLLRCDDAERDARVNREVCHRLGISSVVVMPVVNDCEVLGVFELFSGKAHAFGERDLAAVQRLSEMVETAVRLAKAAQSLPEKLRAEPLVPREAASAQPKEEILDEDILEVDVVGPTPALVVAPHSTKVETKVAETAEKAGVAGAVVSSPSTEPAASKETAATMDSEKNPQLVKPDGGLGQPVPLSPVPQVQGPKLLWSAAAVGAESAGAVSSEDQSNVPPVLRGLKKCEACGFPISGGRVLCVECEEKKWRGQLRRVAGSPMPTGQIPESIAHRADRQASTAAAGPVAMTAAPGTASVKSAEGAARTLAAGQRKSSGRETPAAASKTAPREPVESGETASGAPLFGAGLVPSQSWLGRNKYVLGVLVAIVAGIAGVLLLR